jgi:hypothetical protein
MKTGTAIDKIWTKKGSRRKCNYLRLLQKFIAIRIPSAPPPPIKTLVIHSKIVRK